MRRSTWDEDPAKLLVDINAIRKKLKHYTAKKLPQHWLNTGSELLNKVMGSGELGIPYGRLIEISGDNSNGKTALLLELAKYAQRDGAIVIWVDLENSFDADWAKQRGLNCKKVVLIQPYVFETKKKDEDPEMSSAEDLCKEARYAIFAASKHVEKIFVAVDSIAAMITDQEAAADEDGANMNTTTSLSRFLSRLMKKWTALASTKNVMFAMVNQIRMKPGVMFGDPETTPGGKAIPFYTHIRVRMRRVAGGRMKKGNEVIGIKGTITNVKNKAGSGSVEGAQIGFKLFWKKRMRFLDVKEVKAKE